MKKTLLIAGLVAGFAIASFAQPIENLRVFATNIVANGSKSFSLIQGRAVVKQVELTSQYSTLVQFYNQGSVADPYFGTNYVKPANVVTVSSYSTNMPANWVDVGGITNYMTNIGYYTYYTTNLLQTTNLLSPTLSFAVAPGTYAVFPADAICERGLSVWPNTNVSVVIYYK